MVQEFRIAGQDETEAPGLLGLLMKAESKEMKEVFIFDMSDSEDVHEEMGTIRLLFIFLVHLRLGCTFKEETY